MTDNKVFYMGFFFNNNNLGYCLCDWVCRPQMSSVAFRLNHNCVEKPVTESEVNIFNYYTLFQNTEFLLDDKRV